MAKKNPADLGLDWNFNETPEDTDSVSLEDTEYKQGISGDIPSQQAKRGEGTPASVVSKSESSKLTDLQSSEVPKYLQLERKEVRLRLEQLDELTNLTRRLNRSRKGKGERLTENTLIRVAIDLLLEKSDQLQGSTEDELLKSVSLEVTE